MRVYCRIATFCYFYIRARTGASWEHTLAFRSLPDGFEAEFTDNPHHPQRAKGVGGIVNA